MCVLSRPWPQILIEHVEYEAFWGVPGHQKAENY